MSSACRRLMFAAVALLFPLPVGHAQVVATVPELESTRTCDARVESVLLYQGRAAVTRKATVTLTSGVWRLRFAQLPASVQPETIEAKSSVGRILSVDYLAQSAVESPTTAEAQATDAEIKRIDRELAETKDTLSGLRADQRLSLIHI